MIRISDDGILADEIQGKAERLSLARRDVWECLPFKGISKDNLINS